MRNSSLLLTRIDFLQMGQTVLLSLYMEYILLAQLSHTTQPQSLDSTDLKRSHFCLQQFEIEFVLNKAHLAI